MDVLLHKSGLFVSNFYQFTFIASSLKYFPKSVFNSGFDSSFIQKGVIIFRKGEDKKKLRRRH